MPSPSSTLSNARVLERDGSVDAAGLAYQQAVRETEESGDLSLLCEALRRLAMAEHRRNRTVVAGELCQRSYDAAVGLGDRALAGEALNTLGGFELDAGSVAAAQLNFENARSFSTGNGPLGGRIERNLGLVRSIQGDPDSAMTHFQNAVQAFHSARDECGMAMTRHSIGVLFLRMGELDAAARELSLNSELARTVGDVTLQAQSDLGHAELFHACRQFDGALERASAALERFEQLDSRIDQSAAHRLLGMIYRDTHEPIRASERLHVALALAIETGWILGQADALRELGLLESAGKRTERAGTLFRTALDLYAQLEAWTRVAELTDRMARLDP